MNAQRLKSEANKRPPVVLMDFGGTLDADGVHWAVRFHDAYRRVGGTRSLAAFEPIFRQSDDALAKLPNIRTMGFRSMVDAQADVLRGLLPDGNVVDTAQMAEHFRTETLRTIARNRGTLDALQGRVRLAVISNFTGNLEPCLAELGIRDYFDVVADSGVEGVTKPDPMLFLHTLHTMGVAAHDAWIVGDNFETDIRPAHALGLQTCWLAPAERSMPAPRMHEAGMDIVAREAVVPTARIALFTDIPAALGCTA